MKRRLVAASALLLSCGGAPSPEPQTTSPAANAKAATEAALPPPPPSENGRLPRGVTPTRYALDLAIDPAKDRFRGEVQIDVTIDRPTPYVVLHGRDLALARIEARSTTGSTHLGRLAGKRRIAGDDADDELILAFSPALPAGAAKLLLTYDAPFGRSLDGLYRAKDRDRNYAFTQFEPTDARRMFPCFDEPMHKTPFELSVRVPKGMQVVANAPEVRHVDEGATTHFSFAPTLPIPTYLVALAVGEFDIVEGRKAPFPIRVVTTKGRGASAQAALAPAAEIIDALAKEFGVPYPYPKLDLVSVPDFGAGAMENPGLVTFREEILLADPARPSPSHTRGRDHIVAHELAHQWFGDLVTMEWWDDLWLNESFATWAANRVLEGLRPAYRTDIGAVKSGLGVMDFDALPSAKPVHRTVRSVGEAMEAFDGITYEKGEAVIRMLEHTATPARFRQGIQSYLEKHAFKTARTEDLVAAVSAVSPTPLEPIAKSFLEQSGVPNISVERDCKPGKGGASLVLSQYPWSPLGAGPPSQPLKQWAIPICLREEGRAPACSLMTERRVELPLHGGCGAWAYPNADRAAYARLSFSAGDLAKLVAAKKSLDAKERLGLMLDAWAAARAGELAPDALLATVKAYDGEPQREIFESQLDVLWGIGGIVNAEEGRARVRDYVRERLLPRKRALGWGPADALLGKKPGADDDDTRLVRRAVLFALGELADDEETLKEADVLADAWLKDRTKLDPETGALALELGSRRAGVARFQALVAAIKKLDEPADRIAALRALGAFGDPNLVTRALDYAFEGEISLKDSRYVIEGALRHRASVPVVLAWNEANWERATRRYEGARARRLIDVVFNLCERKPIEEARAFYKAHPVEGGARLLDEALEQAGRCATLAEALGPGVVRALGAGPKKASNASPRGQ